MAHNVTCTKCGQRFDRDKVPFEIAGSRRYAHKECPLQDSEKTQEITDLNKLEDYIKIKFNEEYVNARIRQQINNYRLQYKFTYSGILKTLVYFFDIKGNDLAKAQGGIGIVPFVYKEASKYYYDLFMAKEINKGKDISQYKPEVVEIIISSPKRQPHMRNLFQFLDEGEDIMDEQ